MSTHDWLLDQSYMGICHRCKVQYLGPKRSMFCRVCTDTPAAIPCADDERVLDQHAVEAAIQAGIKAPWTGPPDVPVVDYVTREIIKAYLDATGARASLDQPCADPVVERSVADPHVSAVRNRLADRAEAGMRKYGVDTTRPDFSPLDWLRELQDELLDAAVYAERLKADFVPPEEMLAVAQTTAWRQAARNEALSDEIARLTAANAGLVARVRELEASIEITHSDLARIANAPPSSGERHPDWSMGWIDCAMEVSASLEERHPYLRALPPPPEGDGNG